MNRTGVFILGLIGSILGIIGTFIWLFFGGFFFGGMIDYQEPLDAPLTDTALIGGFLIAGIQCLITLVIFIISLVKSTPGSLRKGYKNSGIWLLVLGIVVFIINFFHFIPAVLLIIAGALALNGAGKEEAELRHQEMEQTL